MISDHAERWVPCLYVWQIDWTFGRYGGIIFVLENEYEMLAVKYQNGNRTDCQKDDKKKSEMPQNATEPDQIYHMKMKMEDKERGKVHCGNNFPVLHIVLRE